MANKIQPSEDLSGRTLAITRLLNAPRELVWEAWTNPDHIKHWWGPEGFTNSIDKMEVKPGGVWQFIMHGPDGTDFRNEHHYVEVVKPERIVMDHVTGPKFRMTATFTEEGDKTRLHLHSEFESAEQLEQVIKVFKADVGMRQNMDKLEAYLKHPNRLVIERGYEAPPELIWAALTDPAQMKQWYFDLPDFKAEVGYQFQFDGGPPEKSYLHLCEVKEAAPNKRLAYSWRYDGYPGDSLVRFEIISEGTTTKVRLTHIGLESFAAANNPDFDSKNFQLGWTEILSTSLTAYVERQPKLTLTRSLDAPRDLVFKVWTQPDHLANWWGPAGMELRVLKFDLRPGGIFHYSMIPKNGPEMYGRMAYREIVEPERLVWVNSFADAEGNVAQSSYFPNNEFPLEIHNVLTLTEENGKTTLTLLGSPINASEVQVQFYKSMFSSMEKGFEGTFDKLSDHLQSLMVEV